MARIYIPASNETILSQDGPRTGRSGPGPTPSSAILISGRKNAGKIIETYLFLFKIKGQFWQDLFIVLLCETKNR